MGGLDSFLRAIPDAAKSPYSLIAYAVAALLFIVSATKLTQVKKKTAELVLATINLVNPNERKQVIDGVLGTILPSELTGEQYLRSQKMRYAFLAFMGLLIVIGTIIVIALMNSSKAGSQSAGNQSAGNQSAGSEVKRTPEGAKIRVQLWPRPEIKENFLKNNDARLYLKTGNEEVDLVKFVPNADFLDATTEISPDLIGKVVDVTIGPREKYRIAQVRRRYLTPLVRLEVYPLGSVPVPPIIASIQTPAGEKVFRTTDLPILSGDAMVAVILSATGGGSFSNGVDAGCPHVLYVRGTNLSVNTRLDVVDSTGKQVEGGWAGNEPGLANSKPAEVNQDGMSLKAYFEVPSRVPRQQLFLRVWDGSAKTTITNIPIHKTGNCPTP